LGDREPRKEINLLLQNSLVDPSPERRRLKEIIGHVRAGYLDRWANALKVEEDKRVKPERFSRTVAAHRLDLGFSASHLKVWARRLDHDRATAVEIAESAAKLARTRARPHEVLVALEKVPGRRELAEPLDDWRSKGEVITWLKDNGHDPAGIRTGGGFVYRLDALDPYGAAEQARQLLDRMVARSHYLRAHRGGVVPVPRIWVAGHPRPVPLDPPARGADVLSLVHEGHLYKVDSGRGRIDDALELAAAVNRGGACSRRRLGCRRVSPRPRRRPEGDFSGTSGPIKRHERETAERSFAQVIDHKSLIAAGHRTRWSLLGHLMSECRRTPSDLLLSGSGRGAAASLR